MLYAITQLHNVILLQAFYTRINPIASFLHSKVYHFIVSYQRTSQLKSERRTEAFPQLDLLAGRRELLNIFFIYQI